MQKINFLPQVKLWNAAEFNSRPIWNNPDLGSMTYDASKNVFAVTLKEDGTPTWKYLLTGDSSTDYALTTLRLMVDANTYTDRPVGNDGVLTVYTASAYNDASNPLATLADVQSAVAGASVLGLRMDSSIIHIDASYIHLKSDSSHPYSDTGDAPGSKVNPLATVATVESAITNALAGLGDLFDLQGVYTNPYNPSGSSSITTFDALLTYLLANDPFDIEKGSVIIFGDKEYVLIDESNYSTSAGWEILGSIDSDTCVISIGDESGVILLSDSFYMNNKTLTLNIASDASRGGVRTGYTETLTDSSTKYNFALKVGANASVTNDPADRGYVTIPIVTGAAGDASYGIIANGSLTGNARIYSVTLDPSSLRNVGIHYSEIKSIKINHNMGSDDLVVSVYKVRTGENGTQRHGRQLVYVDEIISGPTNILVDFGSAEAFLGCQDKQNDAYLGYIVVIATSTSAIDLNTDPSTSFQANVEPDAPTV